MLKIVLFKRFLRCECWETYSLNSSMSLCDSRILNIYFCFSVAFCETWSLVYELNRILYKLYPWVHQRHVVPYVSSYNLSLCVGESTFHECKLLQFVYFQYIHVLRVCESVFMGTLTRGSYDIVRECNEEEWWSEQEHTSGIGLRLGRVGG